MSMMQFEDFIVLDKGSQVLRIQFERHCEWCWKHGYGYCDICRKRFHKYYIPLRIAEKQKELGLPVTREGEVK